MGKVDGLIRALEDMAACSEQLMKAATDLGAFIKEKNQTGKSAAETKPPESAKAETKKYSFIEVRKAFSAKAHEGHTEQLRALIAKYGADKLSAVKEEDFAAIMADLEALS